MRLSVWIVTLALFFLRAVLAFPSKLDCLPIRPMAPIADCRRVLAGLEKLWRSSTFANRELDWGRDVEETEMSKKLPFAFQLDPFPPGGHRTDIPACEFFIDNRIGRAQAMDTFRLQDVAEAVEAGLALCYPLDQTAIAFPTQRENVYVLIRYRNVADQMANQTLAGNGADRNYTVFELPRGDDPITVMVDSSATS